MAIEVRVPNIGDFKEVPVIDILVKPGEEVKRETPLLVLESDKATMEVPSPEAGTISSIAVKVGDKVSEGTTILTLTENGAVSSPVSEQALAPRVEVEPATEVTEPADAAPQLSEAPSAPSAPPVEFDILVPDIGEFKDVSVIDVLIKPGDHVEKESPLVVLESDKATMEVPSPAAGTVSSIAVKVGDKVSQGTPIAKLTGTAPVTRSEAQVVRAVEGRPSTTQPSLREGRSAQDDMTPPAAPQPQAPPAQVQPQPSGAAVHASPSIRRFARELGVDLSEVRGSGPNGRITREDVQGFVKGALSGTPRAASALPFDLPPWPKVDFAQYGPIDVQPLSRIKKISGPVLHRNWVTIPHVTNHEDADITDLEEYRQEVNAKQPEAKLTILAFVMKAVAAALRLHPELNASLDGDNLVLKRYYHIGFAADTPQGLLVPVVRDVDKKGVLQIARETRDLAAKAREGKLTLAEMQGASFTISSLGGIGGTGFTPIINAPEVAILGVSRAATRAVWTGKKFKPRLILPLSLSYDHRVIDGALAARFNASLVGLLADIRGAVL